MKKPKKPRKSSVIKALQKKALDLWYMEVKRRDGRCMIMKHFSSQCYKSSVLQAHHVFSKSKHRNICLDMFNGVTLCSGCHTALSFGNDGLRELVREIVIIEHGQDVYDRLFEQSLMPGPHLCWRDPGWLEEQVRILEGMVNEEKL